MLGYLFMNRTYWAYFEFLEIRGNKISYCVLFGIHYILFPRTRQPYGIALDFVIVD